MINFRFHLVSLTAVLLALGVGLVLGTAFVDEAVVGALRGQLDGLESDLGDAREQTGELRDDISFYEDEQQALDAELSQHVVDGSLEGAPVLFIHTEGTDDELVDRVFEGLTAADADVLGAWELTERFALDDDDETADLADALGLTIDEPDRLRSNVVIQLADVLYGPTDAAESVDPGTTDLRTPVGAGDDEATDTSSEGEGTGPGADDEGSTDETTEPTEPGLLVNLVDAGFINYGMPEDAASDTVLLPPEDLRVFVVGSTEPDPVDDLLFDVLQSLASEGRVPVVVGSTLEMPSEAEGDGGDEDAESDTLVDDVRADDMLQARISTVDNLDWPAGKLASVLALRDAFPSDPAIGAYGQEEGTDRLLPPPPAESS